MNVEIRSEALRDIAEGVAFYDRQGDGAGDYFFQRIFADIEALGGTAGIHETHFGYHRKIATRHPLFIIDFWSRGLRLWPFSMVVHAPPISTWHCGLVE